MPEPAVSDTTRYLYDRVPRAHRALDVDQDWTLLRFLDALSGPLHDIRTLVDRITGDRPAGPATPLPWGMLDDEQARWSANRRTVLSALGDPLTADAAWLPWLAQLVGAPLSPSATEAEQRDTIRYTTSGWRAGTVAAIEDAARSALTGSRQVAVFQHTSVDGLGDLQPGSMWDVTLVTRATETPDVDAVLDAVVVKGVKPAGVVLHHKAYSATWAQIHANRPTWVQWNNIKWTAFHETGLS